MKRVNSIGWVIAAAAVSAIAVAQTAGAPRTAAEAKVVIEARQAVFKDMKKTFDPMTAMLKRQAPFDAAVIATNATQLQTLANKLPALHAPDTTQFKDIKTDALDGIWKSQADFKSKSDALASAAGNAATVARAGNQGATLKAVGEIGKTCGSCHDSYRNKT